MNALRGIKETVRSALLIAHNPGLHELAMTLVGDHAMTFVNPDLRRLAEGYPSGALAEFTVPGPWGTSVRAAADWSASCARATFREAPIERPRSNPARSRRKRPELAPPPPAPEPEAALELVLAPEDVPALSRLPGMVREGSSRPCSLVWFDDPEFSLAAGWPHPAP